MSDRAVCRHMRDEECVCVVVCVVVVRWMSNEVCVSFVYFLRALESSATRQAVEK